MTDHEYKLIERGIDNELLALLEWVRHSESGETWWRGIIYDEELLERFKNRDK